MAAILHLGNLEFRGNGQTMADFQDPAQARTVAKVRINMYVYNVCIPKHIYHGQRIHMQSVSPAITKSSLLVYVLHEHVHIMCTSILEVVMCFYTSVHCTYYAVHNMVCVFISDSLLLL